MCSRHPFLHCQRQVPSKAGVYIVRKQLERDEAAEGCGHRLWWATVVPRA